MRVNMHTQGFELSEALRAYAERRLCYALRPDSARVLRVAVKLEDVNGPRGGVDKRCKIHVVLTGHPGLVVHETQADAYAAIDRAVDRIGRAVERLLDRASVRCVVSRTARREAAAHWPRIAQRGPAALRAIPSTRQAMSVSILVYA